MGTLTLNIMLKFMITALVAVAGFSFAVGSDEARADQLVSYWGADSSLHSTMEHIPDSSACMDVCVRFCAILHGLAYVQCVEDCHISCFWVVDENQAELVSAENDTLSDQK